MTSTLAADAAAAEGVRLELLKPGDDGETLFLMPGVEGDITELLPAVQAMTGPQRVYGLMPVLPDAIGLPAAAAQVVEAIRGLQPAGPYRVGGYSFGALLALEVAQQLRAAGEDVGALFLIEGVYDERFWPRKTWVRALLRRTSWQLGRIVRMRPLAALAEIRLRGVRLIRRLARRSAKAADSVRDVASAETRSALYAYQSMAAYRPRTYPGTLTLIATSQDRHFGCDVAGLWAGLAERLVVQRVDGDHLEVVREPAAAAAVAGVIDHALAAARPGWSGIRPRPGFERPMILSTMRWFAAARLAHALTEAGFEVSACRPRGHVLEVIDGLVADCRLNRLWRRRSLVAAIRRAQPDIILPDDERALALLRRLHDSVKMTDPALAALVGRSLGDTAQWTSVTSRSELAATAKSLGVTAPETAVVVDRRQLDDWTVPYALKTDGSWGGRGVAFVRTPDDVRSAWRSVAHPPSLPRALKRLLVNFEAAPFAAWLRRVRPVVNAQRFIEGREGIVTAACFEGQATAVVCLEVVAATEPRGPAAVIRVIDHPQLASAARVLVERFGLTGFCGFDFMITESGEAYLLEVNARVTPTCHLLVEGAAPVGRTLALFPASPHSSDSDVVDVPRRIPALVRRGETLVARGRRRSARLARRLRIAR
ncbi:thioesterase domain-containing protein [Hamadaea sp. NPDC050747]|uniref:thioesterase domain-containing protein n=1 Tax=Hamadaea sp. NPDC050747 TaxID=3155789 RepID=UPI0033CE5CA2